MKAILITIILFSVQNVYSQTNDKPESSKPSWGSKMPTRDDTPNLSMDTSFDDEDEDEESNDFGFDRAAILDDNDEEEDSLEAALAAKQKRERLELERQQIEETRELTLQQEQKIEDEQQKQRVAVQKALDEKEQKERFATQKILEDEKIADEQAKRAQATEVKDDNDSTPVAEVIDVQPIDKKINENEIPIKINKPESSYVWKKIKNTAPIYPAKAIRAKKEGWVEVEITIDNNGEVVETKIANSHKNNRTFNKSALRAVNKWKYDPPSKYGVTENLTKVVKIVFQL